MPLNVSYMGTKRRIASDVARIIDQQPPGPFLDLFAGMSAVSTAIGQSRPVWCNDIQAFASSAARAFFVSRPLSFCSERAAALALPLFRHNAADLRARFSDELVHEELALASGVASRIRSLEHRMPNVATDAALDFERAALAEHPSATPYRLFSITYSGGYFGLAQSIEIDSIRFAIDRLLADATIAAVDHRWLCLALCQATSKVATTTGHFAQHMRANDGNYRRYVAQRRRPVWPEWLRAVFENHPVGSESWRRHNRVFRQDANTLLHDLHRHGSHPAVVYADPPYTRDQFSRYYHLYETLIQYDYPTSSGSGPLPSRPLPLSLFHEDAGQSGDGGSRIPVRDTGFHARSQLSRAGHAAVLHQDDSGPYPSILRSSASGSLCRGVPLLFRRFQGPTELPRSGKNLRGTLT